MQRILVLGAGFAGLWSAIGAARELDLRGIDANEIEVLVIDRRATHSIRVRNYEADLTDTIIPLATVLGPVGVRHLAADVTDIDLEQRTVTCVSEKTAQKLSYDRLVFALGSRLPRPAIPGLEAAFDVDTYEAAERLHNHIVSLPNHPESSSRATALVVGSGPTGIEVASELPERLRLAFASSDAAVVPRVILADRQSHIGSDMGAGARSVIARALQSLGVECRPSTEVIIVDSLGVILASGERIDAETVIWCAGMRANPLTDLFPGTRDGFGRLPVDHFMRVSGRRAEFAAGDAAWFKIDKTHISVMSCQHARPMGRYAGRNVVCDLLGENMLPLDIDWYTTIVDLGPWGAVYTEGWDRNVVAEGAAAKLTKQMINQVRIYPPRDGDRRAILDAAIPSIQRPPTRFKENT